MRLEQPSALLEAPQRAPDGNMGVEERRFCCERLLSIAPLARTQIDAALLRLAAAGCECALRQLYERYSGLVNTLAFRMLRNQAQADDVQQETLIHIWRAADTYDPTRGTVSAWIATIARNLAISTLRHQALTLFDDDVERVVAQAGGWSDPEAMAFQRELGEMVRAALTKLPRSQRTMILLAYYQGWTHTQIAEYTGIPLGTVKSRLRLALKRLKALLSPARESSQCTSAPAS